MTLTRRKQNRGAALIELAIVATLLLLLVAGAGDFGRIFTEEIAVKAGTATGAMYGSERIARTDDVAGITSKVDGDTSDAGTVATAVEQYCTCPQGNGTTNWTEIPCDDFSATTCNNGYADPRAYIKVNATKSFTTQFDIPGIHQGTTIDQTTWMRAR